MTQFQYFYSVKNFKGINFLSNILFIQHLHVSIVRQLYIADIIVIGIADTNK